MTDPPLATSSFLATRRGKLVLAFLCAVAFLDFLDTSIVNVALPSIARDLHFSAQNLQWVLSGYVVSYGGFLLLGARLAEGLGAALMSPAALSILTTRFSYGTDRVKALGAWGAMAGMASVAGVFL